MSIKYTAEDINRFRDTIADAMGYVDDAGDEELIDQMDQILDYLVYLLDEIYDVN